MQLSVLFASKPLSLLSVLPDKAFSKMASFGRFPVPALFFSIIGFITFNVVNSQLKIIGWKSWNRRQTLGLSKIAELQLSINRSIWQHCLLLRIVNK